MRQDVSGNARLQDEVLEELSGATQYRRWICGLAEAHLGATPLEIGSGCGDYAAEWAASGVSITASEADPSRLAGLQHRFRDEPLVAVRQLKIPSADEGDYSAVVAVNVLEHIDNDVEALRSMRSLMASEGRVILFVPAFEFAMSKFDREVGHFRRYRRDDLSSRMRSAGLEPVAMHYVNVPGLLAWLLMMKMLGGHPREGIALDIFERLVPAISRVEERWRPWFGQSLFAVGASVRP